MKFMKKGSAAHQAVEQADAVTAAKKASAGIRRFWMPQGASTSITFLDGDLTEEGLLDTAACYEHQVKKGGHWLNWYPCTQEEEPCPICEDGHSPVLVAFFTIIDHAKFNDREGKTRQNERRLFACKRDTFKLLQQIATKRGGLAGCKFDVSRIGEKAPNVGSHFDFDSKVDLPDLSKLYDIDPEQCQPYDYDEVITYFDADALRKLGFGSSGMVVGNVSTQTDVEEVNYDRDI